MSGEDLSGVIACQERLLAALDARDPDLIEEATAGLADAISRLRTKDSWRDSPGLKAGIEHALRQNDAARMRVNIMSEWTRQRSAQLAELRGQAPAHVYGRAGRQPG